ncbi:hypothetical protein [Pseudogracilibacillus sp. ICA-222130]|uniref:hypothetical protein n=1 Tax=Pseudogracilibacillus sp. ICA-222130 TaxID=3134655 RepID=UPI0030C3A9C9
MIDLYTGVKRFQEGKMIRTFKTLQFMEDGDVIKDVNWRTIKAKELFCYLLQHKSASKEELTTMLWPEYDETKAMQNLYTTIYQIKSMLKSIDFNIDITNTVGRYEMILHDVAVDLHIFESVFDNFESLTDENYRYYDKLMKYYTGDYLKEENFSWKANKNEQLKILYITMINTMIEHLKVEHNYFDALLLALTIQKHYPTFQNNYLVLMQLYDAIGEHDNVRMQYANLTKILGRKPNNYITKWYGNWTAKHSDTDDLAVSN